MSMIRLPPTSISLSESDIQIHLREINIYQSLLERGFKRQDIQRYYVSTRLPVDSQSSQQGSIERAHRAASDEKQSIMPEQEPTRSRDPEQHELRPEEMGKANIEADPIRTCRAPKTTSRPVVPVGQESRREGVGRGKQPSSHEAGGDAGRPESGIVETVDSRNPGTYAPTTVDLRTRARVPSKWLPFHAREPPDDHEELSSQIVGGHGRLQEKSNESDNTADSHSPPIATNFNLPNQHCPRQSSLLHITRNAASPSSSGHSDDSFKSTVTKIPRADSPKFERSPRARTMTYRPRSQTYPWVESEADDPTESKKRSGPVGECSSFQPLENHISITPTITRQTAVNKTGSAPEVRAISITRIEPSPAGSTIIKSDSNVSSFTPLRAEAEDFVPLRLPPPFSATTRVSSGQHSLPSGTRNASPNSLNHDAHSRSSPNIAVSTPPRSSSIGTITRHLGSCFTSSPPKHFPSSPPKLRDPEQSPLLGPSIPVPTGPNRRTDQAFRGKSPHGPPKTPRTQLRIQQTDGPGMVYDDRVAAHLQPRTPADLTRGLHITEQEAAYTAPPGRTSRTPATISQALMSPLRPVGPEEESPSRRARTMRERRERELRRTAAVEDAMWNRFRAMEGDVLGMRMPLYPPRPISGSGWRDDFDADRVGEENFDVEASLDPRMPDIARSRR